MQLLEVDTLSKRKKNVKICIKNIIIVSTHIQTHTNTQLYTNNFKIHKYDGKYKNF